MNPDVIFYYPQHFNRSKQGTNPYFDPLLNICKDHNIPHILFEEPDSSTDKPRNLSAQKADILFWFVVILRKLLRILKLGKNDDHREYLCGRIFNFITFGKYKVANVITISNSMSEFWHGVNPNGKVYDLQHGIIYSTHPGYFEKDGELKVRNQHCVKRFLVWGDIYKKCFYRNSNNLKYGENKVITLGYPLRNSKDIVQSKHPKNIILISLQITSDLSKETMAEQKRLLRDALIDIYDSGYKILLRHHPRFNNEISLTDLLEEFPLVEITKESMEDLAKSVKLHITWDSTTTFEYASHSIPTYFLRSQIYDKATPIFYNEYQYPLYQYESIPNVILRINNPDWYKDDCVKITYWYNNSYSELDKELFLKLISG